MGQTLSEPITTKESSCCHNDEYRVGSSCMQGWRINMEDSHTHILSLPEDESAAFFAVYDGHGGAKVAEYASKHLHKYVTKRPEYQAGSISEALKNAFLEIDSDMRQIESLKNVHGGSTAIAVLVKDKRIYCANVGDSRAIMYKANEPCIALSCDHKPWKEDERNRIHAAGGYIEYNRVNGNLALSRALGDYNYKLDFGLEDMHQIVTAYPEVQEFEVTDDTQFIVIACDGIWDVMINDDVAQFVHEHIAIGDEPEVICEKLMMRCLSPDCQMGGTGCDNMTVILICFLHGQPYSTLVEKCRNTPFKPEFDAENYEKQKESLADALD